MHLIVDVVGHDVAAEGANVHGVEDGGRRALDLTVRCRAPEVCSRVDGERRHVVAEDGHDLRRKSAIMADVSFSSSLLQEPHLLRRRR